MKQLKNMCEHDCEAYLFYMTAIEQLKISYCMKHKIIFMKNKIIFVFQDI